MRLEPRRVLLIDDDENFCVAMSRWLEMLGYQITATHTAEEGVQQLEAGGFDVVLLDLTLPGIHGHAVLRELNRQGVRVPVVVVSGSSNMNDAIEAFRLRAVDYLRKPFRMEELATALERAQDALDAEPLSAAPALPAPSTPPAPDTQMTLHVRQRVIDRVRRENAELPVLDPRVSDVQALMEQSDEALPEILKLVERDPALTVAVLRAANSSYYTQHRQVANLHQACVRLGNRGVLAIVLETIMRNTFDVEPGPYRVVLQRMWRNAFITARIAGRLARRLRPLDVENIYVAALLHNVGELMTVQLMAQDPAATVSMVGPILEQAHEEVGAHLTRAWSMPILVCRVAGKHHQPVQSADGEQIRLIVLAAWHLSLDRGFTYLDGQQTDVAPLLRTLGLAPRVTEELTVGIETWLQ